MKISPFFISYYPLDYLFYRGLDPQAVAALLGHANTNVTTRVYSHPEIIDLKNKLKDI